ncbi:hypothetical protein EV693_1062 [Nicoletella semolina]|uniref:Uncharacterized protein n=1 Tax=Nicoletella semolina TaxID=271160 RepID=A0A4R2N8M6_9PAST|nr:hypothetical protein [Nicoletella semolina]MDH2924548.1 hypothetical protein [Nicoletella semolina]TCP17323.1 hypothetical protein EV693_1062 [Nicoletella semolina]
MMTSLLAFTFTLLGFVLIAYILFAFPFLFILLLPFAVYKVMKWQQKKQQNNQKPHYQNSGVMPRGVEEDLTNEPLSFQPKR